MLRRMEDRKVGDVRQPAWLLQGQVLPDKASGLLWWLHQWTREELWMLFIWTSVRPLDMIPHNTLLPKLEREGFEGWHVRLMRNWKVVVNSSMFRWRLVMSDVLYGSISASILFNTFINDINSLNNSMCHLMNANKTGFHCHCFKTLYQQKYFFYRNLRILKNCSHSYVYFFGLAERFCYYEPNYVLCFTWSFKSHYEYFRRQK